MDIHDLRAELRSVVEEMETLDATATDEERDLTEEEQADYDELEERARKLERRISRMQAARERRDRLGELDPAGTQPAERRGRITEVRDYDASDFRNLGEFIHSVRFNPFDQRLRSLESRADAQAMGGGLHDDTGDGAGGPLGGFAVPEQFRSQLLEVAQQSAIIRPRATVIPAGSPPDAEIFMPALDQTSQGRNRYGGVSVNWIEEAGSKPQTDFNLAQVSLSPYEVAGHIVATDKLLRNWSAADTVIRRLLGGAVTSAQETAFVTGNGSGKPTGFVGSSAAYTVNRDTASQIKYVDVAAMYARMLMGGNPVWVASQSILPQLLNMVDGDGRLIFQPGVREGVQPQLLGFPIIWNERSPALGTKGDLAFVDLQYYLIKDGSGPFIAASEHVNFLTNQTVIKVFFNVDGKPWLSAPLPLENGYSVSPFVVLDVPAGDGDGDGDGDAGDA